MAVLIILLQFFSTEDKHIPIGEFIMVHKSRKNHNIGGAIRTEVRNAILNKTAEGLNQFINKLNSFSQNLLSAYLTQNEFPFSRCNSSLPYVIKFDVIKVLKILNEKNQCINLTNEHLYILWKKVSEQLNDMVFSLMEFDARKMFPKNIYDNINDRYAIKNNLNLSNDSSNNYEYGPQGVPSQKRSRYKRRYHRK